jgi:hypothetical protein
MLWMNNIERWMEVMFFVLVEVQWLWRSSEYRANQLKLKGTNGKNRILDGAYFVADVIVLLLT